jgi:hypothetical protein
MNCKFVKNSAMWVISSALGKICVKVYSEKSFVIFWFSGLFRQWLYSCTELTEFYNWDAEFPSRLTKRIFKYSIIQVPIVKPTRCTSFSNYLFLHSTLHVSDGLSVHHQEFKTVQTATGICQIDTAVSLLAGTRWNSVELIIVRRKDRPKHVVLCKNK